MPACEYCSEVFDDDDAYVEHLKAEHADELGPIDRRRIEAAEANRGLDIDTGPVALGVVLVGAVVVIGIAMAVSGGSGGAGSGAGAGTLQQSDANPPGSVGEVVRTPTDLRAVHYHGTMTVIIEGEEIDFSRSRYQLQDRAFHYENGDGSQWHVHARGVTLEYALATLGIGVTDTTVTVDGTTYRDSAADTSVTVTVNGEPVTPSAYVLERGDSVRIVVETG